LLSEIKIQKENAIPYVIKAMEEAKNYSSTTTLFPKRPLRFSGRYAGRKLKDNLQGNYQQKSKKYNY
jgi:hypothetical protein